MAAPASLAPASPATGLAARIRALAGLSPASLRLAEKTAFETVLAIR